MRLLFDIETNGLMPDVNRVHCIVIKDLDSGTLTAYSGIDVTKALSLLKRATFLTGHNIMGYDLPVLAHVFPGFTTTAELFDTLVASRLIWPEIKEKDFELHKRGALPGNLVGSHGLEAWGHRLRFHKGDYAKEMKAKGLDPWAEFNQDMLDYCVNDVELNAHLLGIIERKNYSKRSLDLEHGVWTHCLAQMEYGCAFDEAGAADLYADLCAERAKLERTLTDTFGSWEQSQGWFTPKRDNAKLGYKAGVAVEKFKTVEFNPSSRDHIAHCLKTKYGWKPAVFTANGKPCVDEAVLGKLDYPEAKLLTRYLLLQKRIGQIAEGTQGWLKLSKGGRVYGRLNTNGAVTGRATHQRPNLGQVPRVGSPWGRECRSLFIATPGWALVGADASGLELRCLAHFLAKWDGGEYSDIILNGDIHTANQTAAGLPTRNDAKTFIYALLYGAGDEKIGSIIGKGKGAGRQLRKQFMEGMPAFASLVEAVSRAAGRGYLTGLDGRILPIRSPHAALNTLLQSAGAVIMKQAMVNFHALMASKGYVHGRDYRQVLWVHDEFQVECKQGLQETVGSTMVDAIRKTTTDFEFRCPLDGEFKTGTNWAETH
jgi:DNA polymerase I